MRLIEKAFSWWGRRRAGRVLRHLERGNFKSLLGGKGAAESFIQWANRQAATPHTERVVLRLTMTHGEYPWFLWAVYRIIETNPPEICLDEIRVPDGEKMALKKPEDLDLDYYRA